MNKFNTHWGDIFVSKDFCEEYSVKDKFDANECIELQLEPFFGFGSNISQFREYADLYGKSKKLSSRYGVLSAHGDEKGGWIYLDNKKEHFIQDWINKNDGRYSTLLINSCNPGNHTPISKRSLLFVPDKSAGGYVGEVFNLIHPNLGDIGSSTISYELKKLKEKLGI